MDNPEEVDNLGKKIGSGKIFIAVTRKQRGGWRGGGCPSDVGASVRNPAAGWGLHLASAARNKWPTYCQEENDEIWPNGGILSET